jgi:hypothetical protein
MLSGWRVFRKILAGVSCFALLLLLSIRPAGAGPETDPCGKFQGEEAVLGPGFRFPRTFFPDKDVRGEVSSSVCDYTKQGGRGTGVGYSSANAPLTIYVLDGRQYAGAGEAEIKHELSQSLQAVFAARKAGIYRDVEPVDLLGKPTDSPILLEMPLDGVKWFVTLVKVTDKSGAPYTSYTCVAASKGSLVKVRLSLREEGGNEPLFGYTLKKVSSIIR